MHGLLRRHASVFGIWLFVPALMWAQAVVSFAQKSESASFQVIDGVGQTSEHSSPAIQPPSPEQQGDLMMLHGSYEAAIGAYQHATLTSPVVWNKIGIAYHHLYAFDEARKAYQRALIIDPRYADALNNLGAIYHGQREYKLAERTYRRALKYAPNSAVTYLNLGTAYFAQSKYKQGVKAYQRALAMDPEVVNSDRLPVEEGISRQQLVATNYYLARACAAAGKLQQAIDYLRKALNDGFNDRKQLMEDKEFATLRTTPEFRQLLAEEHLN